MVKLQEGCELWTRIVVIFEGRDGAGKVEPSKGVTEYPPLFFSPIRGRPIRGGWPAADDRGTRAWYYHPCRALPTKGEIVLSTAPV